MSLSRHVVVAWLSAILLVLQLAAPAVAMPRPTSAASVRLAMLAKAVGHIVMTCHDEDGGHAPAGDAGPCCPCTLCHALALACPTAPIESVLVRRVAGGQIATYPQPPPLARAVLLGLSSPRGPPLLA